MKWLAVFLQAAVLSACATPRADQTLGAAAARIRPSVVLLTMDLAAAKSDAEAHEYASGIVIASGNWGSDVLTVSHALEGALKVGVTTDNQRSVPARIIARDVPRDLALVRIKKGGLPVAQLGSSADAEPGVSIGLLGYPIPDQFENEGLGLAASLGAGIVSTLRPQAIEVTLPIVPGESGGPIFLSESGEIIGMAEARFENEHSIGFAIPMNTAKRFLKKFDSAQGF